ncbi:hypothetical protein DSM106972_085700 [Dulcicalothrix desertica PCC 7102]|uniref:Uncharacterized protein n=1 Tax=Dulcicalothrix desertica PCC 7102 TaxID=232991 RepID=A0A3S1BYJ4_9CYAN|nr:hypothetical protein [Dulcicalothrix desertica]RUS97020.1 hypothetical protein DSM106972_085700 [Dulcicalothrix desertica PCC 7102]TWH53993.1 hypothetical protein CAL7102_01993 [Dulcicalothrix desertica PCC 7102]
MTTNTYTPVCLDIIDTLNGTTATILEFAKALATDQKYLSRADFSKLVQSLGWSKDVVKKYINIGIAFFDIEISRLINIEATTLFKITSNKRFAAVVDGIKSAFGLITQQFVEHLIQSNKKVPVPNQSTPTIWRGENATRRCVIPPIKEDDQFTGTTIQRAMDDEKITAQRFVREAAAYREAYKLGAFELVGDLPPHLVEILGIEYETRARSDEPTPSTTASFDWEAPSNTSNIEESPTILEESRNSQTVEKNEHPNPSPAYSVIEIKSEEKLSYKRELSANDIAELLKECATWSEIEEITSSLDKQTRTESWLQLSREEQTRVLELKRIASIEHIPSNIVEETPIIKVGDTVIWNNCWPHLSSWNPFQVENIEDDYAKLNNLKTPVPVEELSLVSCH